MKVKRFTLNPTKNLFEETVRYKVKGNKLIVTTYNKKGKLTEEKKFQTPHQRMTVKKFRL